MSDLPNWKTMEPGARDDLLRRYVEEGFSATEIAKKFTGCFRNSIIGRAHRMGLKLKGRQKAADPEPKPTKSRETTGSWGGVVGKVRAKARRAVAGQNLHAGNIVNKAESRKVDPVLRISRAAAFDPLPGTEPVPYGSSGCKFPVDGLDGQGLLWCGADRGRHPIYCSGHQRLAFRPRQERFA